MFAQVMVLALKWTRVYVKVVGLELHAKLHRATVFLQIRQAFVMELVPVHKQTLVSVMPSGKANNVRFHSALDCLPMQLVLFAQAMVAVLNLTRVFVKQTTMEQFVKHQLAMVFWQTHLLYAMD